MFDSFRAYGRQFRSLWVPPFRIVCLYLLAGCVAVYLSSLVCAACYLVPRSSKGTGLGEISRVAREQPFSLPAIIVIGLLLVFMRGMIAVARQGTLREFLWCCGIMVSIGILLSSVQVFLKGWWAVFGLGFWYFFLASAFYELGRYLINRKCYPAPE